MSMLDRRIDFVLLRGAFAVRAAVVTGDDPGTLTSSGLWASDHAGVAALLKLPK
jgi:endonuclease/exonuclease/phosphatase family metal-dependent hydrolase